MGALILEPPVVRACLDAYDQALDALIGSTDRRQISDSFRSELASVIIELADEGVSDTAKLRDAALARARELPDPLIRVA